MATELVRSPSYSDEKHDLEGKHEILTDEKIAEVAGAFFEDPNIDREHIEIDNDSPYPEVRSAVANTDDPDMPCTTIRAWTLGLIAAIIIPGLNQFFFFRYPSVNVGSLVAQLLFFPVGRFWAYAMPKRKIFGVQLNPGPFSVKEHVLVTIMATVGGSSAYATDIVAVQRVFYNEQFNFSYQWFLVLSTQMIGFSLGGVCKRFLVSPPSMIWPANLVYCALFNTLHSQEYTGVGSRGGISRERFFLYAFLGSFAWYFFPGYIFQALSYFSWVVWIRPQNATIAQLFGTQTGLGMGLLTFDWSQIAYIGSPLSTPWWAEANVMAGFILFFWIITPALYYTNTFYTGFLPISSRTSFDRFGNSYNVTRILTPQNTLDIEKYKAYSPLFLSATFAFSYGLSFAAITATIMHSILYFRKQIWVQARRSLNEQPDIHARLMSRYRQVPEWWYIIVFLCMFVFGILTIELWPTNFPVWAFVLSLIIAFVYTIPIGMIQAITNQQVGLNVITELIIGYALPGRPIAMMMFKTWGYIAMAQALQFTSDFKLGHYMKIPPRSMFWSQVVATVVSATVQLGVQAWMFTNIPNMCDDHQKDKFRCPSTKVFGTASIIWGVIGPANQFSKGQLFYPLTFFFLIGALGPVIPWLITRRYPNSFFKYINLPVIFTGTGLIPPATAVNYVPWGIVGFIFQYVVRRRHFAWWTKYNYVLSAALDAGVAVSAVFIFFVLQYPKNGKIGVGLQNWWGNSASFDNCDGDGCANLPIPDSGHFGPDTW
ncbi:hypothetical protein M422DRAFT_76535 [Sphaerobolus stellatus SS14]|uniref:OPT oligopeptide transporter n=1 Tax=Sphaerobolus stellatus (strain SS14) TaxID=990650 RepID=A0A0C9UCP2_SPHS4|nr:hypothetical protein M422DRAFT_76535 [Sphaerobolus stellatus SS14]